MEGKPSPYVIEADVAQAVDGRWYPVGKVWLMDGGGWTKLEQMAFPVSVKAALLAKITGDVSRWDGKEFGSDERKRKRKGK